MDIGNRFSLEDFLAYFFHPVTLSLISAHIGRTQRRCTALYTEPSVFSSLTTLCMHSYKDATPTRRFVAIFRKRGQNLLDELFWLFTNTLQRAGSIFT